MNLFLKRIIASHTLFLFLLSQIFTSTPAFAVSIQTAPAGEVSAKSNFRLTIPAELGTVVESYPGTQKTLIHIQDAHGSYEAQKNTAAILHYLNSAYGADLLLLEGASTKARPDLIRFFPRNMKLTETILDKLARKGLLSGSELFLAKRPDVEAYGIEDRALYLKNGEDLRKVLHSEQSIQTYFETFDHEVEGMLAQTLNKKLRTFLKRKKSFEKGHVSYADWLQELRTHAKELLRLDLLSANFQFEWPMLVRISKLDQYETELNRKALLLEAQAFLAILADTNISSADYQAIETVLQSKGRQFDLPSPDTELLFERMMTALPSRFSFESFPNVRRTIASLIFQSEIDAERLSFEVGHLTQKILDQLARTEQEKQAITFLQDYDLTKQLLTLQLTPSQHAELVTRADEVTPAQLFSRLNAIRGEAKQFQAMQSMNQLFQVALSFYEGAQARDRVMIQNAERLLIQSQKDLAVVITGGFHAEPFKANFTKKSFNYALISPTLTDFNSKEIYHDAALLGYEVKSARMLEKPIEPWRVHSPGRNAGQVAGWYAGLIAEAMGENGTVRARGLNTAARVTADEKNIRIRFGGNQDLFGGVQEYQIPVYASERVVQTQKVYQPTGAPIQVRSETRDKMIASGTKYTDIYSAVLKKLGVIEHLFVNGVELLEGTELALNKYLQELGVISLEGHWNAVLSEKSLHIAAPVAPALIVDFTDVQDEDDLVLDLEKYADSDQEPGDPAAQLIGVDSAGPDASDSDILLTPQAYSEIDLTNSSGSEINLAPLEQIEYQEDFTPKGDPERVSNLQVFSGFENLGGAISKLDRIEDYHGIMLAASASDSPEDDLTFIRGVSTLGVEVTAPNFAHDIALALEPIFEQSGFFKSLRQSHVVGFTLERIKATVTDKGLQVLPSVGSGLNEVNLLVVRFFRQDRSDGEQGYRDSGPGNNPKPSNLTPDPKSRSAGAALAIPESEEDADGGATPAESLEQLGADKRRSEVRAHTNYMAEQGDRFSVDFEKSISPEAFEAGRAIGAEKFTANPASAGTAAKNGELDKHVKKIENRTELSDAELLWQAQQIRFAEELDQTELSIELDPTVASLFELEITSEGKLGIVEEKGRYVVKEAYRGIIGRETVDKDFVLDPKMAAAVYDVMVTTWVGQALEIYRLHPKNATVKIGNTKALMPFMGDWGRKVGVDTFHIMAVLGINRNFTLGFAPEDADQPIKADRVKRVELEAVQGIDLDTVAADQIMAALNDIDVDALAVLDYVKPSEREARGFRPHGRSYHSDFVSRRDVKVNEDEWSDQLSAKARGWFGIAQDLYILITRFNDQILTADLPASEDHGVSLIPASIGTKLKGQPKYLYVYALWGAGGERVTITAPQGVYDAFNELDLDQAKLDEIRERMANLKADYAEALESMDEASRFARIAALIAAHLFKMQEDLKGNLGEQPWLFESQGDATAVMMEIFKFAEEHSESYAAMNNELYREGDAKFHLPQLQGVAAMQNARSEIRTRTAKPVEEDYLFVGKLDAIRLRTDGKYAFGAFHILQDGFARRLVLFAADKAQEKPKVIGYVNNRGEASEPDKVAWIVVDENTATTQERILELLNTAHVTPAAGETRTGNVLAQGANFWINDPELKSRLGVAAGEPAYGVVLINNDEQRDPANLHDVPTAPIPDDDTKLDDGTETSGRPSPTHGPFPAFDGTVSHELPREDGEEGGGFSYLDIDTRRSETRVLSTQNPFRQSAMLDLLAQYETFAQSDFHLNEALTGRGSEDRAQTFRAGFSNAETNITLDYSKNLITSVIMGYLLDAARKLGLADARDLMFSGAKINVTEDRAVGHVALRKPANGEFIVDGQNVVPDVHRVLGKMKRFVNKLNSVDGLRGYTGKRITDVVNIGIGGSDLGPVMVTEALKYYRTGNINTHFVSNVDGTDETEKVITKLNPETTLFIIASKTFTTQETMQNATLAKQWFLESAGDSEHVAKHFVAVSTAKDKVAAFGIDADNNMFEFWDWVGGRYSLWSAIGLSIAAEIGFENFEQLLAGAHAMDNHFQEAPFHQNLPVIMALIEIWYTNYFKVKPYAILPYSQYLHRVPAYMQQAFMESNGKGVNRAGDKISYFGSPAIFGEAGTNGQHSFYQDMHQGFGFIPADFIGFSNPLIAEGVSPEIAASLSESHDMLTSNFLAQTQALALGKGLEEVLQEAGIPTERIPHKVFEGNRPTNSILINDLTPHSLGALIALYEHRIFSVGAMLNVFSYDQWGVELGKVKARTLQPLIGKGKGEVTSAQAGDASTASLLSLANSQRVRSETRQDVKTNLGLVAKETGLRVYQDGLPIPKNIPEGATADEVLGAFNAVLDAMIDQHEYVGMTTNPLLWEKAASLLGPSINEEIASGNTKIEGILAAIQAKFFTSMSNRMREKLAERTKALGENSPWAMVEGQEIPIGTATVSAEVSSRESLSGSVEGLVRQQAAFQKLGSSVIVKTMSTEEGIEATRQNPNVRDNMTLLFGLGQFYEILDAQLTKREALFEQAEEEGRDLLEVVREESLSFASIFASRVDILYNALIDEVINHLVKTKPEGYQAEITKLNRLKNTIGVAGYKQAYADYERVLGERPIEDEIGFEFDENHEYEYEHGDETEADKALYERNLRLKGLADRFEKLRRKVFNKIPNVDLDEFEQIFNEGFMLILAASTGVKEAKQPGVDPLLYFINFLGPNQINTLPGPEKFEDWLDGISSRTFLTTLAGFETVTLRDSVRSSYIIKTFDPKTGEITYFEDPFESSYRYGDVLKGVDQFLKTYRDVLLASTNTEAANVYKDGPLMGVTLAEELASYQGVQAEAVTLDREALAVALTHRGNHLFMLSEIAMLEKMQQIALDAISADFEDRVESLITEKADVLKDGYVTQRLREAVTLLQEGNAQDAIVKVFRGKATSTQLGDASIPERIEGLATKLEVYQEIKEQTFARSENRAQEVLAALEQVASRSEARSEKEQSELDVTKDRAGFYKSAQIPVLQTADRPDDQPQRQGENQTPDEIVNVEKRKRSEVRQLLAELDQANPILIGDLDLSETQRAALRETFGEVLAPENVNRALIQLLLLNNPEDVSLPTLLGNLPEDVELVTLALPTDVDVAGVEAPQPALQQLLGLLDVPSDVEVRFLQILIQRLPEQVANDLDAGDVIGVPLAVINPVNQQINLLVPQVRAGFFSADLDNFDRTENQVQIPGTASNAQVLALRALPLLQITEGLENGDSLVQLSLEDPFQISNPIELEGLRIPGRIRNDLNQVLDSPLPLIRAFSDRGVPGLEQFLRQAFSTILSEPVIDARVPLLAEILAVTISNQAAPLVSLNALGLPRSTQAVIEGLGIFNLDQLLQPENFISVLRSENLDQVALIQLVDALNQRGLGLPESLDLNLAELPLTALNLDSFGLPASLDEVLGAEGVSGLIRLFNAEGLEGIRLRLRDDFTPNETLALTQLIVARLIQVAAPQLSLSGLNISSDAVNAFSGLTVADALSTDVGVLATQLGDNAVEGLRNTFAPLGINAFEPTSVDVNADFQTTTTSNENVTPPAIIETTFNAPSVQTATPNVTTPDVSVPVAPVIPTAPISSNFVTSLDQPGAEAYLEFVEEVVGGIFVRLGLILSPTALAAQVESSSSSVVPVLLDAGVNTHLVFSTAEQLVSTTDPVVNFDAHLASVRERLQGVSADGIATIVMDSFWIDEFLGDEAQDRKPDPEALLSLLQEVDAVATAVEAPSAVVTVFHPNPEKVFEGIETTFTNVNVVSRSESRREVIYSLLQKLKQGRLLNFIPTSMDNMTAAMESYALEHQGMLIPVLGEARPIPGVARFWFTRKQVGNDTIGIGPLVAEVLVASASVLGDVNRDLKDMARELERILLNQLSYAAISKQFKQGMGYLVPQRFSDLIRRFRTAKLLEIMA